MAKKGRYIAWEVIEYRSSDNDGKLVRLNAGEAIPKDFPENDRETLMDQKAIGQETTEPEAE